MKCWKSEVAMLAILLAATFCTVSAQPLTTTADHVLLLSIDGMHALDLQNYAAAKPGSNISQLVSTGVVYPMAYTTNPSDSFPGMVSLVTGGGPGTTGVYYDDAYDRALWAADNQGCLSSAKTPSGSPGTEVNYAENIDIDVNSLSGGGDYGVGSIDVTQLPFAANCSRVYPHNHILVNTVFEVIKAAGKRTAWSDKHPAYDILNGPSGKGIDDLWCPEINSLVPNKTDVWTVNPNDTITYDGFKVKAILNQINGLTANGSQNASVPALFGMNFQAVSVAQKSVITTPLGGYLDSSGTPNAILSKALDFVDASVGQFLAALTSQGIRKSTAIIFGTKHGQNPIDPATFQPSVSAPLVTLINATVPGEPSHYIDDDVFIVWLSDPTKADTIVAALQQQQASNSLNTTGIRYFNETTAATTNSGGGSTRIVPFAQTPGGAGYAVPGNDSRAPDFVGFLKPGAVFVSKPSKPSKSSEHGGASKADRNVALLVNFPAGIKGGVVYNDTVVYNTQVAPTILTLLGLDPTALQAVGIEKTSILPALTPANTA